MLYARGSRAKGRCDCCGFTVLLSKLIEQVEDGRKTGSKFCKVCNDPDHPIYQRGRLRIIDDPQTLRDPRPDADRVNSTSFYGWAPIGNPLTSVRMAQGQLIIVTENN